MRGVKRKSFIIIFTIIIICSSLWYLGTVEVSTRQGIDYVVNELKIPLYLKTLSFLSRHFEYKRLVKDITYGLETNEEKLLAIFNWTVKNIRRVPPGMPIVDDHVLNIIIRGYGTQDQSADVFTTLCVYAGFPAAMYQIHPSGMRQRIIVSWVYVKGRYLIFDPYNGNFFRNEDGEIADIDDIIRYPEIIQKAPNKPAINGIQYVNYFNDLTPISSFATLRAELQMPLPRLYYEIMRRLHLMPKAILFYGGKSPAFVSE